jgi:ABC-type amino acid transport substrate-binding protein
MKISIGNLIDQLTVANTRIWMAEDIKRKPDATDKEIADATKITNVVNQQRNDLIQAIDESLNHMVQNGEIQKIYKQGTTKIYGKK